MPAHLGSITMALTLALTLVSAVEDAEVQSLDEGKWMWKPEVRNLSGEERKALGSFARAAAGKTRKMDERLLRRQQATAEAAAGVSSATEKMDAVNKELASAEAGKALMQAVSKDSLPSDANEIERKKENSEQVITNLKVRRDETKQVLQENQDLLRRAQKKQQNAQSTKLKADSEAMAMAVEQLNGMSIADLEIKKARLQSAIQNIKDQEQQQQRNLHHDVKRENDVLQKMENSGSRIAKLELQASKAVASSVELRVDADAEGKLAKQSEDAALAAQVAQRRSQSADVDASAAVEKDKAKHLNKLADAKEQAHSAKQNLDYSKSQLQKVATKLRQAERAEHKEEVLAAKKRDKVFQVQKAASKARKAARKAAAIQKKADDDANEARQAKARMREATARVNQLRGEVRAQSLQVQTAQAELQIASTAAAKQEAQEKLKVAEEQLKSTKAKLMTENSAANTYKETTQIAKAAAKSTGKQDNSSPRAAAVSAAEQDAKQAAAQAELAEDSLKGKVKALRSQKKQLTLQVASNQGKLKSSKLNMDEAKKSLSQDNEQNTEAQQAEKDVAREQKAADAASREAQAEAAARDHDRQQAEEDEAEGRQAARDAEKLEEGRNQRKLSDKLTLLTNKKEKTMESLQGLQDQASSDSTLLKAVEERIQRLEREADESEEVKQEKLADKEAIEQRTEQTMKFDEMEHQTEKAKTADSEIQEVRLARQRQKQVAAAKAESVAKSVMATQAADQAMRAARKSAAFAVAKTKAAEMVVAATSELQEAKEAVQHSNLAVRVADDAYRQGTKKVQKVQHAIDLTNPDPSVEEVTVMKDQVSRIKHAQDAEHRIERSAHITENRVHKEQQEAERQAAEATANLQKVKAEASQAQLKHKAELQNTLIQAEDQAIQTQEKAEAAGEETAEVSEEEEAKQVTAAQQEIVEANIVAKDSEDSLLKSEVSAAQKQIGAAKTQVDAAKSNGGQIREKLRVVEAKVAGADGVADKTAAQQLLSDTQQELVTSHKQDLIAAETVKDAVQKVKEAAGAALMSEETATRKHPPTPLQSQLKAALIKSQAQVELAKANQARAATIKASATRKKIFAQTRLEQAESREEKATKLSLKSSEEAKTMRQRADALQNQALDAKKKFQLTVAASAVALAQHQNTQLHTKMKLAAARHEKAKEQEQTSRSRLTTAKAVQREREATLKTAQSKFNTVDSNRSEADAKRAKLEKQLAVEESKAKDLEQQLASKVQSDAKQASHEEKVKTDLKAAISALNQEKRKLNTVQAKRQQLAADLMHAMSPDGVQLFDANKLELQQQVNKLKARWQESKSALKEKNTVLITEETDHNKTLARVAAAKDAAAAAQQEMIALRKSERSLASKLASAQGTAGSIQGLSSSERQHKAKVVDAADRAGQLKNALKRAKHASEDSKQSVHKASSAQESAAKNAAKAKMQLTASVKKLSKLSSEKVYKDRLKSKKANLDVDVTQQRKDYHMKKIAAISTRAVAVPVVEKRIQNERETLALKRQAHYAVEDVKSTLAEVRKSADEARIKTRAKTQLDSAKQALQENVVLQSKLRNEHSLDLQALQHAADEEQKIHTELQKSSVKLEEATREKNSMKALSSEEKPTSR